MGKYDKLICTILHKKEMLPGPSPREREQLAAEGLRISLEHVLWLDDDIIPGAYYGESTWIWPQSYPHQISQAELARRFADAKPMFPHAHSFPELLSWWGTDPDHPEDTTTKGLLLENEEILLDRSWVAYVPAGMMHMPTKIPGGRVSSSPVCHWTAGPGEYTRDKGLPAPKTMEEKEPPRTDVKKSGVIKNAEYIIYGNQPGVKKPDYLPETDPRYSRPIAYIDQNVIPGAEFGCNTMWLLPGDKSKTGEVLMKAHTLPHGTSITLTAMNYEDITDLCGEVELWIGGEKHVINKCFGAYIPPGVEQGPLIVRNIRKQIFFNLTQPVGEGIKKYPGR